jgi:hypothetical protein
MMNLRTIVVACALAGLAACSESVSPVAPSGPQYDGGVYTAGSGGRAGGANGSDTTTVVISSTETTTTERSGHTFGGGH